MKRGSLCFVVPLAVVAAGCTMNVRPVPVLPEAGAMPQVEIHGRVSVVAGEVDPEPHRINVSPYTMVVSYGEFTDATVRAMQQELTRRGVDLGSGDKTLAVSVIYVAATHSVGSIACVVDYRLTTGDGAVHGVQASESSGWGFSSACDGAVSAAVGEILRDPGIAAYLRGVPTPTATPAAPAKSMPPPETTPQMPPTPAAKRSPPPSRSVEDQLKTLDKMRRLGLVSPGEYEEKRRIILGTPPQP